MVWARDFNLTTNTAGFVIDVLKGFQNELGIIKNLPGITVTRVVGTLDCRVVSVDDAFTRLVWGIHVAEENNPATVGQNPLSSPEIDWMFVRQEAVVQVADAGTPVVKRRVAHYDLDLHSQRKLDEIGSTLFFVCDNPDGDNFDVAFQFNILLKLP